MLQEAKKMNYRIFWFFWMIVVLTSCKVRRVGIYNIDYRTFVQSNYLAQVWKSQDSVRFLVSDATDIVFEAEFSPDFLSTTFSTNYRKGNYRDTITIDQTGQTIRIVTHQVSPDRDVFYFDRDGDGFPEVKATQTTEYIVIDTMAPSFVSSQTNLLKQIR